MPMAVPPATAELWVIRSPGGMLRHSEDPYVLLNYRYMHESPLLAPPGGILAYTTAGEEVLEVVVVGLLDEQMGCIDEGFRAGDMRVSDAREARGAVSANESEQLGAEKGHSR